MENGKGHNARPTQESNILTSTPVKLCGAYMLAVPRAAVQIMHHPRHPGASG